MLSEIGVEGKDYYIKLQQVLMELYGCNFKSGRKLSTSDPVIY